MATQFNNTDEAIKFLRTQMQSGLNRRVTVEDFGTYVTDAPTKTQTVSSVTVSGSTMTIAKADGTSTTATLPSGAGGGSVAFGTDAYGNPTITV